MPRISSLAAMAAAFVCCTAGSTSAHRATLDAGLYTLYSGPTVGSAIYTLVCGDLKGTHGCFRSPTLTGFGSACALLEGKPSQRDNVVTRAIYVLDRRTKIGDPLQLFVYERSDTITDTYDTVNLTFVGQVSLGIKGALNSKCWLAGNEKYLYAGSNRDGTAVSIAKNTLTVTKLSRGTPPQHVTAITADDRGYVTVSFDDGNVEFDPNGIAVARGGGSYVMANTRNSVRLHPSVTPNHGP